MKLFVGGFPLDIAEIELVKLFNNWGTVDTIKIVRDKKTRKCKGYAFIEMTDQPGAERAMEALNGYPMGDRLLSVKLTIEQPADQPPVHKPASRPMNTNYSKIQKPGTPLKPKRPRKIV
ncbi:RNA recognition motif domain-containing protein [Mucilaginibacter sp. SP1R1]|uniref:RNA recognition motif domain-containing protein n=1 Tax=Mucilaginibacter sp. SP1R1 TaxID=2723091 RepID=UPI001609EB0A|nr:RNA-binding protein [Mucilaginibacter sp. SP1R1]MBB6148941.1 RNA recognition motif-containing protein [Mucilaginibacter sp. SP1R1]